MSSRFVSAFAGSLIFPVFLAGCQGSTPSDQVAVKGEKFEVTLAELEQVLRQAPPVSKEQVAPARRAFLKALVDQKLLAEAAADSGLDKTVEVVQAFEATKRSILAQAYIRKLVGTQRPPGAAEVQKYYDAHPDFFARRRRAIVNEVSVPADDTHLVGYSADFDRIGFDSLIARVAKDGGRNPQSVVLLTDTLPEKIASLEGLRVGSLITYQTGAGVHFGQIQSIDLDPVAFDAAKAVIGQRIISERTEAIVEAAVSDMRKARKVEVVNKDLKRSVE